jgi:AcrR family transcriptional regulator
VPVRRSKPSADRILEAAEKVFEESGYGDVSLRQLMAAAGVSTTAFYARFDSKEAVMAALVTRLFGELFEAAPGVLDQTRDLESGIERGVALLCERFAPRKALVRMILSEAGSASAAVEARRKAYGLLVAFLAARIAQFGAPRGERTGDTPSDEPTRREPDVTAADRRDRTNRTEGAPHDDETKRDEVPYRRALRERTRGRARFEDPTALAWALVGALEIQVVRWAVWNQIEVSELRDQLRASARAVLRMEAS